MGRRGVFQVWRGVGGEIRVHQDGVKAWTGTMEGEERDQIG